MKALSIDKPLDSNLKPVKDSDGTLAALELSTGKVRVKDLDIAGSIVSHDLNDKLLLTPTQILNFGFNYGYTAGTKIYVPLNGYVFESSSLTARNEFSQIIAPFDGYLDRVVMRSEAIANSSIVGLHKSSNGTELPSTTASATVTIAMDAANTSYNFAFGQSASFSAGDILAISFTPYRDTNDTNGTAVFIYDRSEGL